MQFQSIFERGEQNSFLFLSFYKEVELVSEGQLSMGPTLSSFYGAVVESGLARCVKTKIDK